VDEYLKLDNLEDDSVNTIAGKKKLA
jgi:hypothetical protein